MVDRSIIACACGLLATMAGAALAQPATAPQSQPASQLTPEQRQRIDELNAIVVGQNQPPTRRIGARDLLRLNLPAASERLVAILSGEDPVARAAVAQALADLPEFMEPRFIDPLIAMLGGKDPNLRAAASTALAADRSNAVIDRLRPLIADSAQPVLLRRAAIDTLGNMVDRDAVQALATLLSDADPEMQHAAMRAIESSTGQTFNTVEAAVRWWNETRELPLEEWQRRQIEALLRDRRERSQRFERRGDRLVRALRDTYLKTAEIERPTLLLDFLADEESPIRLLGLELVRAEHADRKPIADEIKTRVREILTDANVQIRRTAVQLVPLFRQPSDCATFLSLLQSETHPEVRLALINGLGHVGDATAVEPLVGLLQSPNAAVAVEAAGALGRLGERKELGDRRAPAVEALKQRYAAAAASQPELREALLSAMGRVGDPGCAPVFAAALSAGEPSIRRTAALGLDLLGDPAHADALTPLATDGDASVRAAAVTALRNLGSTDAHLQALWSRLPAANEPNAQTRDSAWQGVLRIVASRPPAEIEALVGRLPDNGETRARRALELLQLAEAALAANPARRADLGRVRAAMAAKMVELNRGDDAVAAYTRSLEDLHAVESADITRVSLELLRFALASGRYDQRLAAVFINGNPPLDGAAVWQGLREDIEQRLRPEKAEEAIRMLLSLQEHPPAALPAEVTTAMREMLGRARAIRAEADAAAVNAALSTLAADPNDEAARGAIVGLGPRAAPALRAALETAIRVDPPEPQRERLLHDLLRSVLPEWAGFPADATREAKLAALDRTE